MVLAARLRATVALVSLLVVSAAVPVRAALLRIGSHGEAALRTSLSTNVVYAGTVEQAPGAPASLRRLRLPLVRVHIGDDGTEPPALPEIRQGQWSFSALDALVSTVYATHQQPLVNIKFAPDWMWTCHRRQGPGTLLDLSFSQFADYLARLVSYYNRGYMITESGRRIDNPWGASHRVTWWELWNEPDLNNETPCADPRGYTLDPQQYRRMWDAATVRMLQVSPDLHFVGPATGDGQFGSGSQDYLAPLKAAQVAPSAISFHGYGYWDTASLTEPSSAATDRAPEVSFRSSPLPAPRSANGPRFRSGSRR